MISTILRMIRRRFETQKRYNDINENLKRMEAAEEQAKMPSQVKPGITHIEVRGNIDGNPQSMDDYLRGMGIKK